MTPEATAGGDSTPEVLAAEMRAFAKRYEDTMGLTREGAIRRIDLLHDGLLDFADRLTALKPEAVAEAVWQPIETAPRDGTVVLTNCGTARWQEGYAFWMLCHVDGSIPSCADWGYDDAEMQPSLWMPFPAIHAAGLTNKENS